MREPIEALISRCGEKYLEADQEIETKVNHIILWELYRHPKYPAYNLKNKRKRRRKNNGIQGV